MIIELYIEFNKIHDVRHMNSYSNFGNSRNVNKLSDGFPDGFNEGRRNYRSPNDRKNDTTMYYPMHSCGFVTGANDHLLHSLRNDFDITTFNSPL